jgi:membrane-associated protease RseP (regulator of RpoE activity)
MAANSPFADIGVNATIVSVNGRAVQTEHELLSTLGNTTNVTLGTAGGNTVTGPTGALVQIAPGQPAATAGMPVGETVVITEVAGERIHSQGMLNRALSRHDPNDTVSVSIMEDGATEQYDVVLGEQADGSSFLGVRVYRGISGMVISDFGTKLFPAGAYLSVLGGEGTGAGLGGFIRAIGFSLILPLVGSIGLGGLEYNFAGFAGWNLGFFQVTGPLAPLGGGVFVVANVLFWTGWINLNLGFFNCIPAFPLDGGHLLRMMAESVISRLPLSDRRLATRIVTTSVGVVMLISLFVMLFGPQLLR